MLLYLHRHIFTLLILTFAGMCSSSQNNITTLEKKPKAIPEQTTTSAQGKKHIPVPAMLKGYGLHYSPEELTIWRKRAKTGPYKSPGDAGINSPGDWKRIYTNAELLLNNPESDVWAGPEGDDCVQQHAKEEPQQEGMLMRDAAFVYLITQDPKFANAAKHALLQQIKLPATNFSDSLRWCPNILHDVNPGFIVAEWLTRVLFTYDYIKAYMSESEREQTETWLHNAALYFQHDIDSDLTKLYINREHENYKLSNYARALNNKSTTTTHYGGYKVYSIHTWYNNRRSSIVRFYGLTGVLLQDPVLINSAKKYVREWLMFGVFPDGTIADFNRWTPEFPDKGWNYAVTVLSDVAEIADALARTGDAALLQYTTAGGVLGSEGENKSIKLVLNNLISHVNGTFKRYATDSAAVVGDNSKLIDGKNGTWEAVNDTWFAQINLFYEDVALTNLYTRKHKKLSEYPRKPASQGANHPWSGAGSVYPGVLFMFGQMEKQVWPYPLSRQTIHSLQTSQLLK
ncbi:hypothetical protein [Pontibacter vulgaris]|uniref:hypothetical protein n=1 Tax=Pontibacter vulgaris TaxID=2905679 RepID=UPI001FA73EF6|nr:hypothetical protein [Pontibacter vulgaris]